MASIRPEQKVARNDRGTDMDGNRPSVALSDVFSPEFVPIIREFARLLEAVAGTHDRTVLMARKAVCLYRALLKNGEVAVLNKDRILTSRSIGFIGGFEPSERVVVVDDVAIKGRSAARVMEMVRNLGGFPTLVVAAFSSDLIDPDESLEPLIAARDLDAPQVYRLTREIVCYVQASGLSDNVDQPVFRCIPSGGRDGIWSLPWTDVAVPVQRSRGIGSFSCPLGMCELPGIDERVCGYLKARVLIEEGEVTVLPFVILPEINLQTLRRIGAQVLPRNLASRLLGIREGRWAAADLLRAVQYALSLRLGLQLMDLGGVCDWRLDLEGERLLFGCTSEWCWAVKRPREEAFEIASDRRRVRYLLRRSQGLVVSWLLGATYGDDEGDSGISFFEMSSQLEERFGGASTDAQALASACLDMLVDEGVLVPFTRHVRRGEEATAERAYRGGEVFTLACADLELLAFLVQSLVGSECEFRSAFQRRDILERIFILFIRWWHAIREERGLKLEKTTSWDFRYDPNHPGLHTKGGVTLVDMLEAMGAISIELDSSTEVVTPKWQDGVRSDSNGAAAVEKFAGDMVAIAAGSPLRLPDGSEASLLDVLEAMLSDGNVAYRLRRLQPLLEKLPASLQSLAFGDTAAAADLADSLAIASDFQRAEGRFTLISAAVSDAAGVAVFDFRQYSAADERPRVEGRLTRYIADSCTMCAEEMEAIVSSGLDLGDQRVARLLDAASVISMVISSSSDNWGGASLSLLESVTVPRKGKAAIRITPNRSARAALEERKDLPLRVKTEVRNAPDEPLIIYFPEGDPVNAVLTPPEPLDNGEGQGRPRRPSVDDIYPERLRTSILELATSCKPGRSLVVCYRKNTKFPRSKVSGALAPLGYQEVRREAIVPKSALLYLEDLYGYLFFRYATQHALPGVDKKRDDRESKEGRPEMNVSINIEKMSGDVVGGNKEVGYNDARQQANAVGGAPRGRVVVIKYGDGKSVTVNEGDVDGGLDAIGEVADSVSGGQGVELRAALSDVRSCRSEPEKYTPGERGDRLSKLKNKVELVNSLHELWLWLFPLLREALHLQNLG